MTTYVTTKPKARKQHRCFTCLRVIEPGETYARTAGLDNGEAWTYSECSHCRALLSKYHYAICWDEEYDSSSVMAWAQEGPHNMTSARDAVHWRRQWRNLSGNLYPVPC